jgi:glyoxylase-like metal-dependent hydrolase (beta-lactamase superfamily II)
MSVLPVPSSSDPGVYHVYALRYAKSLTRRVRDNFMAPRDLHDGPMPINYYVWIVTNSRRTILVDSGFGERAAAERGRQLDFDPVEAVRQLGIEPDRLEDLIITHLHFDHAGNIERFSKARIHIQESEAAYATGRCMCEPRLRFPFDIHDIVALMKRLYADRVVFHDSESNPFPGISLHALPGHSKGVQAVRVVTPRGPVLLASDVSHYYANFLRREPFWLTIDVEATLRSYTRLIEIAGSVDRIVPGHDPKVWSLYPLQEFNGLPVAALHEEPKPHTADELARLDDFSVG